MGHVDAHPVATLLVLYERPSQCRLLGTGVGAPEKIFRTD